MKRWSVSILVLAVLLLSGLVLVDSTHAQPAFFYKGVTTGNCQQGIGNFITVTIGTNVNYCYYFENTLDTTSTITATITDDKLGSITGGSPFVVTLAPGERAWFTKTAFITANTVNTADIVADWPGSPTTSTSGATVNVQQGSAVPAFSEWGLVLFMLLIVFTSIYTLRKRRA